ncbi:hypothetical protein LWM68_35720 [Niabella sp. W65]|nr:hypothetical protein [Niabella sp. W65]MCH7367638.1 hypothetical protein [Niabella sp. W65]
MLKQLFVTAGLAFCLAVTAQTTVTGYVYVDQNNNGQFDKKTGLADVAVSNGRDIAATDKNGLYQLLQVPTRSFL